MFKDCDSARLCCLCYVCDGPFAFILTMRCCTFFTATLCLLLIALMQSKAAGTLAGRDSTIVAGSGTVELVVDARPAAASGGGTAAASAARDDNVDASAADAPPPAKRSRRLPSDEELAALQQALGYSFKDSWLLRQVSAV